MEAPPPDRLSFSLGAVPSPAKAPLQRDSRWEKRQRSSPQGDAGVRRGPAEEAVWWRGHSKQEFSCALVNEVRKPPHTHTNTSQARHARLPTVLCALVIGFTMDYLGWTAFFVKHVSFTLGKCVCPDFSHSLTLTDGGSGASCSQTWQLQMCPRCVCSLM